MELLLKEFISSLIYKYIKKSSQKMDSISGSIERVFEIEIWPIINDLKKSTNGG